MTLVTDKSGDLENQAGSHDTHLDALSHPEEWDSSSCGPFRILMLVGGWILLCQGALGTRLRLPRLLRHWETKLLFLEECVEVFSPGVTSCDMESTRGI